MKLSSDQPCLSHSRATVKGQTEYFQQSLAEPDIVSHARLFETNSNITMTSKPQLNAISIKPVTQSPMAFVMKREAETVLSMCGRVYQ